MVATYKLLVQARLYLDSPSRNDTTFTIASYPIVLRGRTFSTRSSRPCLQGLNSKGSNRFVNEKPSSISTGVRKLLMGIGDTRKNKIWLEKELFITQNHCHSHPPLKESDYQ